jgi:hypothetical protein
MATLVPWTTVEIGDVDVFAPAVPCLLVNTWYVDDDEPTSTVTYFWQDEATGLVNHEIVFAEPVGFDEALAWAEAHAPTRSIERIHVKHGPAQKKRARPAAQRGARKKAAGRKTRAVAKKARTARKARKARARR